MEPHLRDQVNKALAVDNIRNAIFLGERLCATCNSEVSRNQTEFKFTIKRTFYQENTLLLAKCYIRNCQDYRAMEVLNKGVSILRLICEFDSCSFFDLVQQLSPTGCLLLAQCMFRQKSDKTESFIIHAMDEAEMRAKSTPDHSNEHYILAEIYYLHGMLCKTQTRFDEAIKQFRSALIHNPFLWPAYEELCTLGGNEEVKSHLRDLKLKFLEEMDVGTSRPVSGRANLLYETPPHLMEQEFQSRTPQPLSSNTSFSTVTKAASSAQEIRESNTSPRTPPTRTRTGGGLRPRAQRTPVKSRGGASTRRRPLTRGANDRAGKLQKVNNPAGPDPHLLDRVVTSTEESAYFSASEQNSMQISNNRITCMTLGMENDDFSTQALTSHFQINQQAANNGFKEFCHFLYTISKGIHALSNCKQDEAIQILSALPGNQQNTPWLKSKLGVLAMQKASYAEAKEMFLKARSLDSTHVEDMDLYSSVLFLLDDNATLNALSKELVDLDRLIPQTWCAVGNVHSALRDHRTALDCFKRAVELDSTKAYSYTLCGHTLLALDDHAKAREYFKQATCLDRRHHFGWYGLGLVEFHCENFAAAASNFEMAISINPIQAVLRLQYGRALAMLNKPEDAEKQFKMSRELDRNNKAACLEQGKLYLDNKRFEDAKRTFQEALSIDSKDPNSFYHLGLTYKKMRNPIEATNAFYHALDLKPGSVLAANIRAALDKINQEDDDPHRKY
eukprot:g5495.t1